MKDKNTNGDYLKEYGLTLDKVSGTQLKEEKTK